MSSHIGGSDSSHFPCTPPADFMYSGAMKRDNLLSTQKEWILSSVVATICVQFYFQILKIPKKEIRGLWGAQCRQTFMLDLFAGRSQLNKLETVSARVLCWVLDKVNMEPIKPHNVFYIFKGGLVPNDENGYPPMTLDTHSKWIFDDGNTGWH